MIPAIIQNNTKAIWQGRCVIIIAPDRGQIREAGSHGELLQHEVGYFSRLHRWQLS